MGTVLHLTVLSPEKALFEGDVKMVTLPGEMGGFTVFPMHAALISTLVGGSLVYEVTGDTQRQTLQIKSGFVEVKNDRVTACVEL